MGSSSALREVQRDLENKANELRKLQKDISKNHQVRKKYTIQLGENELIIKVSLPPQGTGVVEGRSECVQVDRPVLVKQDLAEARANVRKPIEYISAELKCLDATLQDLEGKQKSKQEMIIKLQQRVQSLQSGKGKA